MSDLAWFRMYSEAIDDEKLRLLAFEDRWHFVAILCLKAKGLLDPDDPLMRRKCAVKMGVDVQNLDEIERRLKEVGLIADNLEPIAWDRRQFVSDSSKDRVKAYRERQKQCNADVTLQKQTHNGAVTPPDTDTDTDTDTEQEQRKGLKDSCAEPEKISGTAQHDFDSPGTPAAISPQEDESTYAKTHGVTSGDGGCNEDADSKTDLVIVNLPLNDGSERAIHESDLPELVELYPNCDVITELRNMRGWLLANHARRKTKRGIMVFVHGWFRRAQDGPPARASPAKAAQTLAVIQRKPVNNKHVTDRTPTGGVSFYDTLHSSDGLKTKMFDEEEIEYEARRI